MAGRWCFTISHSSQRRSLQPLGVSLAVLRRPCRAALSLPWRPCAACAQRSSNCGRSGGAGAMSKTKMMTLTPDCRGGPVLRRAWPIIGPWPSCLLPLRPCQRSNKTPSCRPCRPQSCKQPYKALLKTGCSANSWPTLPRPTSAAAPIANATTKSSFYWPVGA